MVPFHRVPFSSATNSTSALTFWFSQNEVTMTSRTSVGLPGLMSAVSALSSKALAEALASDVQVGWCHLHGEAPGFVGAAKLVLPSHMRVGAATLDVEDP